MNKSEELREYFKEMGPSTAAQAAKALGRTAQATRAGVRDLFKKGWLRRIPGSYGVYGYEELLDTDNGRAADLQETMWRAVKISKTFTAWDIAMYSGATLDYVKKYIVFLKKKEIVRKVGKKGQKAMYRCAPDAPRATPIMRKLSSKKEILNQELRSRGWELMRAIRDGDMKRVKSVFKDMGNFLQID